VVVVVVGALAGTGTGGGGEVHVERGEEVGSCFYAFVAFDCSEGHGKFRCGRRLSLMVCGVWVLRVEEEGEWLVVQG